MTWLFLGMASISQYFIIIIIIRHDDLDLVTSILSFGDIGLFLVHNLFLDWNYFRHGLDLSTSWPHQPMRWSHDHMTIWMFLYNGIMAIFRYSIYIHVFLRVILTMHRAAGPHFGKIWKTDQLSGQDKLVPFIFSSSFCPPLWRLKWSCDLGQTYCWQDSCSLLLYHLSVFITFVFTRTV